MKRYSIGAVCLLLSVALSADEFRWHYGVGDKYRVLSTVNEDVYINRRFSHSAVIINRIAFSVADKRADGAFKLAGDFSTSVRYGGGLAYVTDKIYRSEYWLLPDGRFEIDPKYYMPTVRGVPTFPKGRDIRPGDSWTAQAEERHDFREDFGIEDPYTIPITVIYKYTGTEKVNGKTLKRITASYTVFHAPAKPRSWKIAYPSNIAGYSDQVLYWDDERGGLAAYSENFKFVFDLSDGRTVEYRGKAEAKLIDSERMDKSALEKSVRDAVASLKDVSVKSDERGVTISLENIQFEADSARFLPGELEKIRRIAEILAGVKNRDILISGHTALAGTPEARKTLSVERAVAVADELIRLQARRAEEITVIGYGAERPIADNATEEGKSRNRRVEITILEN